MYTYDIHIYTYLRVGHIISCLCIGVNHVWGHTKWDATPWQYGEPHDFLDVLTGDHQPEGGFRILAIYMYLQQPSKRCEKKTDILSKSIEVMVTCVANLLFRFAVWFTISRFVCFEVDKAEAMMDSRVFLGVHGKFGLAMDPLNWSMLSWNHPFWGVLSGKRLHSELENHHL